MLVITRKVGEGFVIGDDVVVQVLSEQDGRVRIGIEAPRELKIYRQEVYERIRQENRDASQWSAQGLSALAEALGQAKDDS
ncbi:MAG: carbon storage regulator CsrA [Thermodesulfobacteriota bacterium]